jgi:hypothetical protein
MTDKYFEQRINVKLGGIGIFELLKEVRGEEVIQEHMFLNSVNWSSEERVGVELTADLDVRQQKNWIQALKR